MKRRIVFLDRGTIGPGVTVRRPDFDHEWVDHDKTSPGEIVARLRGAAIAVTNKVPMSAETIAALPDLEMIAVAATGFNVIDLEACRARNVVVSNIRGYAVNTVPEHTFALMLSLMRNLAQYRDEVLAGRWQESGQFCFFNRPIRDLAGATLGLLGCGSIGRSVGEIGKAFGMNVLFFDNYVESAPDGTRLVDLDELLSESDVISCHCPLTAETRGLLNLDAFRKMKPTAIIINTARGEIVDEEDIATAIREGIIGGAALDVVAVEPPPIDSTVMKLTALPNFILSPHVAWAGIAAMQTLSDQLIDNIEAFARDEPRNVVE